MALDDVLIGIAEEMEKEAEDFANDKETKYIAMTLRGYAKQVRIAVKAQPPTPPPQPPAPGGLLFPQMLAAPEAQHHLMIEREREKIRKEKQAASGFLALDGVGPDGESVVALVGGPFDGDHVFSPAEGVPVGAKREAIPGSGVVYKRGEDGRDYYDEDATNKLKVLRESAKEVTS